MYKEMNDGIVRENESSTRENCTGSVPQFFHGSLCIFKQGNWEERGVSSGISS